MQKIKARASDHIHDFVSAQASTSLQIRVCVWSVTAIPWEHLSVVVRTRPDSVCALILQWEGDAVTSAVTCSLDSTQAWEGNQYKVNHSDTHIDEHHIWGVTSCKVFIH